MRERRSFFPRPNLGFLVCPPCVDGLALEAIQIETEASLRCVSAVAVLKYWFIALIEGLFPHLEAKLAENSQERFLVIKKLMAPFAHAGVEHLGECAASELFTVPGKSVFIALNISLNEGFEIGRKQAHDSFRLQHAVTVGEQPAATGPVEMLQKIL